MPPGLALISRTRLIRVQGSQKETGLSTDYESGVVSMRGITAVSASLVCVAAATLMLGRNSREFASLATASPNRGEAPGSLDTRISVAAKQIPTTLPQLEKARTAPAHLRRRSGTVVFLDAALSQPIAGQSWIFRPHGPGREVRREANPSGEVELPSGRWSLVGWEREFAALSTSELELQPDASVVVVAARGWNTRVIVRGQDGGGVPGALIDWSSEGPSDERSLALASPARTATTDEFGCATFDHFPLAVAGRPTVSKAGYYPSQPAAAPSFDAGVATYEVVLHEASCSKRWGLAAKDRNGAPLEGVEVYADFLGGNGAGPRPIRVGETDRLGRVPLDDWVAGAYRFLFEGQAYPTACLLSDLELIDGGYVSVELPRALPGHFVLEANWTSDEFFVSVAGAGVAASAATLSPRAQSVVPDTSGRIPAVLPEGVDVQVALIDRKGRSWVGVVQASSRWWRFSAELDETELESIILVPRGGAIGSVVVQGAKVVDQVRITAPMHGPSAEVALSLPPETNTLKVNSTDGRYVYLHRSGPSDETVYIDFDDKLCDVELRVKGYDGRPVSDVIVGLDRVPGSKPETSRSGGWRRSGIRSDSGQPNASGSVHLRVPQGVYRVTLDQLPWRDSMVFSWAPTLPADGVVVLAGRRQVVEIEAPRPRRLTLRLDVDAKQLPAYWSVWDPGLGQGAAASGPTLDTWCNEFGRSLIIRDGSGHQLGSLEVPSGWEAMEAVVRF